MPYDTIYLTQSSGYELLGDDWRETIDGNTGERISGKKVIYLNETESNGKKYHNGTFGIEWNRYGLKVNFQAPELLHGSSLFDLKPSDRDPLIQRVYEVSKNHVKTDFENMKVSRLDNTVNLNSPVKTGTAIDVLSGQVSQREGTKRKVEFERETLTLRNKSETITFYDKVSEVQSSQKGNHKDIYLPEFQTLNLLRYEIQNKKPQIIQRKYGKLLTFSDIFTPETVGRTLVLRLETFEDYFLRNQSFYEFDLSVMEKIRNMKSRGRDRLFFMYHAIKGKTQSEIKSALRELGYHERQIFRILREVATLRDIEPESIGLIEELHKQLRDKVA